VSKDGGEVKEKHKGDVLALEKTDKKKKSDKKLGKKEKLSAVPNLAASLANGSFADPDRDSLAVGEGKKLTQSKPKKDKTKKAKKSKTSQAEYV
jgi:hypothetical protein